MRAYRRRPRPARRRRTGRCTGNLTITVNTSGRDGIFTFTSTLPGAATFSLSTNGGTASRVFSGVKAGTYTLSETAMPLKTKRTVMQCGGIAQTGGNMLLDYRGRQDRSGLQSGACGGSRADPARRTE